MDEVILALQESLNILLGALAALAGALLQARLNEKSNKLRLKTEKLERAYFLCQAVYDGHTREVIIAKRYLPDNPEKYSEHRKHPGAEMSELKMLIRTHAQKLSTSLKSIDNGHEPLKKSFRELDHLVLAGVTPDKLKLEERYDQWDLFLKNLSKGSSEIKKGLEEKIRSLSE